VNFVNQRVTKIREMQGGPAGADEEFEFHFNPITPEDWRANEAPLADLFQRGIIRSEYVRDRLNIPEEAGQGTMAPPTQKAPTAPSDIVPTGGNQRRPAALTRERYLLKETKKGIIAEKLE